VITARLQRMLLALLILTNVVGVIFCNQYPPSGYTQRPPEQQNPGNDPFPQANNGYPTVQTHQDIRTPQGTSYPQYPNQIMYRRGFQPPPPQESFLSKIKSSIVAASNAIAGSFDSQATEFGRSQNFAQPSGPGYQRHAAEFYSQPASSGFEQSHNANTRISQYPQEHTMGSTIIGKIKTMFNGEEEQSRFEASRDRDYPHPPSNPINRNFPTHGFSGQQSGLQQAELAPNSQNAEYQRYYGSNDFRGPGDIVEGINDNPNPSQLHRDSSKMLPQVGHREELNPSADNNPRLSPNSYGPSFESQVIKHSPPPVSSTRPSYLDYVERLPADPQVFIHEDNIVMILKPKEFYRKKFAIMAGGSNNLQLFADFEHVLTKFKLEPPSIAGHEKHSVERSLGSMELLELSGAVAQEALKHIQQLNVDFDQKFSQMLNEEGVEESNTAKVHQLYEEMSLQYQQIISKYGNLYSGNILPATRELLPRLGLRTSWKETLQALSSKGVPTFIFSSGFGDVVVNAMLLGGLIESNVQSIPGNAFGGTSPNIAGSPPMLPNNLRIISNFFRTSPDGIVRAFSQPVVHEKNKNVSTAERLMGMPVPSRPNALILGSHEDDIHMTDGLVGLQNQLSVGFLELSEDLPQRLSTYLNTFDAVILGDSSCKFVQSTIEDILHIRQPSGSGVAGGNRLGGIAGFGNIRSKLGQLLGESSDKKPYGDYVNNF